MEYVVHRVLASWIAKGIEEAKGEIAARVDCKSDLSNKVVGRRRGLCSANGARDVGIAHAELVVVILIWTKVLGFDLSLGEYVSRLRRL